MQSGMPRRTTTMKDSHIPNLKYLLHTNGLTSVDDISTRVGLRAEKSSIETQDTTPRSSQASNGHPSLSGSNGRPLTRSEFHDVRKYTTKRMGF
jgi:hypothetical protein